MSFVVAVDGSSGSGKGTLATAIAKKFNLMYLDTGATYRCITLEMINKKIDLKDTKKIKEMLKNVEIDFKGDDTFLNGENVTKEIREKAVNDLVSPVSKIPEVRESLTALQRKIAEGKDVILDGRDIGTVVFPNADVKIYLECDLEERAKRRLKQNQEKGIESTLEECRENLRTRDKIDSSREIAPAKPADDAIIIDTTNLTIKGVQDKVSKIIVDKKKINKIREQSYKIGEDNIGKYIYRCIVKFILRIPYLLVYFPKTTNMHYFKEVKDEGCIVTANHLNMLDAAGIIIFNHTPIDFVGKIELYKNKFLLHFFHNFQVIPVNRGKNDIESIKLCMKALKNKRVLGIFPEGTRKGLEKAEKIKNGAVYLAYKTGKKIVPVGVQGSFKPFTRVCFNYGKPFDPKDYKTDDEDWLDKASETLMKQIVELSKGPEKQD